ncbi:glycosyltransferase family 9 protein [Sphingobacterium composti Ten et al. 2007 non Yoo et al. 2007]|uniref:glycosyltransferase family 9 protein n=1 Tax=Sphingobacterium composti TaxID=363260 RepID=UPI00135B0F4B|nr:glycosyltransferase family 9 protein [Sphingobacterium composti Ten et al. 2007 non Yoo et al. 2007]
MKRIIVTRFSAMGDVAMVASVLKEFQQQHTDTEIIMVSRKPFSTFFEHIPRLKFHVFDPKYKHKGLTGIYTLFTELKAYKTDFVADLHYNIRSRTLSLFFKISGYKTQSIDKGRKEKTELTRPQNKVKKQLKLTTERYADVLRKLGFSFNLSHTLVKEHRLIPTQLLAVLASDKKKIGIAPFAQHSYKVFPLHKMEAVIQRLSTSGEYEVFIFGGGESEKTIAAEWSKKFPKVYNTIGTSNISQELDIISHLDLMISMDSSGMHMASLVGTRCLSVWGATHPFAGFLGFGQSYDDCIQIEHPNRPSSVYGNKPCDCDGVEAIDLVSSEMVVTRIEEICV